MSEAEIWHCAHTRKCGWKGPYEGLLQLPDTEMVRGVKATKGVCPKCGNDSFYVRKPIPDLLDCVREIVEANKTELAKISSSDWWKGRPEQFVGAHTNTVAKKLRKPQWQARYWLTKLEADGMLISHRTSGGTTRWYPAQPINNQPSTIN